MIGSARRQLFISHNHRDEVWLERIHVHLKPHLRAHKLTVWDDTQIPPGAQRQETLTAALSLARAAILLVSPDYLASDLIAEQELPPLLTAAEEEGLLILWLPVRPSSYKHTPIGRYQALHDPEHPLSKLSPAEMDDALVQICDRIIGVVFRALNEASGGQVCLKLFFPLDADLQCLARLTGNAARSLAVLKHPNLIRTYDFGSLTDGESVSFYVVMEYIEGRSLCEWTSSIGDRTWPGPAPERLAMGARIARALHAAHICSFTDDLGFTRTGVIHGDIKPSNVLIRHDGEPVILDFMMVDVQRLISDTARQKFAGRVADITSVCGTRGYMPPEQEDEGKVSVRSDIFSLGVTLIELLGHEASWFLSLDLAQLLDEMTSPRPDERPASAAEVAERLESILAAVMRSPVDNRALLRGLMHRSPRVRLSAVNLLARDESAWDSLRPCLSDADRDVRHVAVMALRDDPRSRVQIRACLRDTDVEVQNAAASALLDDPDAPDARLIVHARLADGRAWERAAAIRDLSGHPGARALIRGLLDDENPRVREEAIRALAEDPSCS